MPGTFHVLGLAAAHPPRSGAALRRGRSPAPPSAAAGTGRSRPAPPRYPRRGRRRDPPPRALRPPLRRQPAPCCALSLPRGCPEHPPASLPGGCGHQPPASLPGIIPPDPCPGAAGHLLPGIRAGGLPGITPALDPCGASSPPHPCLGTTVHNPQIPPHSRRQILRAPGSIGHHAQVGTEWQTMLGCSLLPKFPFSPQPTAPQMGASRSGEGGCLSSCVQHRFWWVSREEQCCQHPSLPGGDNPMSIFGGSCLQLSHLSPSQGQSLSVCGAVEGQGFWL